VPSLSLDAEPLTLTSRSSTVAVKAEVGAAFGGSPVEPSA
jgi:hypothetical protein